MNPLPAHRWPTTESNSWWSQRAPRLYESLLSGELSDHRPEATETYPLQIESLGSLDFPEGRVALGDPAVMDPATSVLHQQIDVERAQVFAVRAMVHADSDHQRVAALVIVTAAAPIVRWELGAFSHTETSASLAPGEFIGFGVDTGSCVLGSPGAVAVAHRVTAADAGMLEDAISKAMFADDLGTKFAALVAPEVGAEPVAACSTGWGDGVYPT